jgi:hypothetical protein
MSKSIKKSVYRVFKCDFETNKELILSLWEKNFGFAGEKRFEWLYGKNSLGNSSIFLLRDVNENLVGINGLIGRTFIINGSPFKACQAIDLLIDRKHRTLGPALQLHRELIHWINKNSFALVYGFPLKPAELVLRRMDYQLLGSRERWVKPLRSISILKKYISIRFVARILSPIVDLLIMLKGREIFKLKDKKLKTFITACTKNEFDDRFDRLWRRGVHQFYAIGERNSSYLKWRFESNSQRDFFVFALADLENELQGYVIYSIDKNRTVNIADLYFVNYNTLNYLLHKFAKIQRKKGNEAICFTFMGPAEVKKVLKTQGFIQRSEDSNVLIYFNTKQHSFSKNGFTKDDWYFTDADTDV